MDILEKVSIFVDLINDTFNEKIEEENDEVLSNEDYIIKRDEILKENGFVLEKNEVECDTQFFAKEVDSENMLYVQFTLNNPTLLIINQHMEWEIDEDDIVRIDVENLDLLEAVIKNLV